jgi:hypothetical protein
MTTKNFSEREFKDKIDMPLNNTNSKENKVPDLNIIKKRKDPKSMTTEELEEYISRNKSNKSLNSSFHSQKNLNYSFTQGLGGLKKDKENESMSNNEEMISKLGGLNYNYLGNTSLSNLSPQVGNNLVSHNNTINNNNPSNPLNSTNNLGNTNNMIQMNSVNNPFLMNNSINYEFSPKNNFSIPNSQNMPLSQGYNNHQISQPTSYAREQLNTQTSNISNDPLSDGEDKYLKFKPKQYNLNNSVNNINNSQYEQSPIKNLNTFNPGSTNTSSNNAFQQNSQNTMCQANSNTQPNTNSKAANNYLKSLQEKTKILTQENEELKKNFVEVSEILEQERAEYQKKLLNEINKTTELEKGLKSEIAILENENKGLVDEINELRRNLSLLNSNLSILEREKSRHLEQNAVEKENLHNEISSLNQENEENKNFINSLNNENELLREKLQKVS